MAELAARGKVRDVYEVDDDHLLLVATDRISAFDVVLPDPIPDKGRVLTGLSLHWFDRTRDLVGNHLVGAARRDLPAPFAADPDLAGRSMLVRRAQVIPMECVARGYLAGSGWVQYREGGAVCGVPLPSGLRESDRLPEPIFTPTTKAAEGHDVPLAAPMPRANWSASDSPSVCASSRSRSTSGSPGRRSRAASSSPTRSSSSGSPGESCS